MARIYQSFLRCICTSTRIPSPYKRTLAGEPSRAALRESKSNLKLKWANVVKVVRCAAAAAAVRLQGSILSMVILYEKGLMAFNYETL